MLVGEITGDIVNVNPAELLFRDATILGSTGAGPKHIRTVCEMVGSGLIAPVISQRFALEEAASAYRLMREGKTLGRVVLCLESRLKQFRQGWMASRLGLWSGTAQYA